MSLPGHASIGRLWKPWYVWRPWQLASRLGASIEESQNGYVELKVAWGASLLADPRKTIGRSIRTTGVYDLAVSEILARLVRRGDTVVDAGANVGYMTLLTAIAAGPSGRVVAWEPHPELFGVLQQNVRSLAASIACANIDLRNAALGERAGTADLIVPPDIETNDGLSYVRVRPDHVGSRVDHATVIAVPLEKIDDACEGQSISVLKLDVEGSEQRVLNGAYRLLSGGRILNIVFEDHDGLASAVIPKLMSFGYEVFSIGWSVAGPRLGPVTRGRLSTDYEAPSYLATLLPEEALRLCNGAGWRTLRQRFARVATIDEPSEYRRECA